MPKGGQRISASFFLNICVLIRGGDGQVGYRNKPVLMEVPNEATFTTKDDSRFQAIGLNLVEAVINHVISKALPNGAKGVYKAGKDT